MECTQNKPITMVTKATIRHMKNHLPFRSGWSSWKAGKNLESMGWMGFVIPLGTSSLVRNSQTTNENWPICPRLELNHVFLRFMVGSCQRCMMAWNQVYFCEAIWNDLLVVTWATYLCEGPHSSFLPWVPPEIVQPMQPPNNPEHVLVGLPSN